MWECGEACFVSIWGPRLGSLAVLDMAKQKRSWQFINLILRKSTHNTHPNFTGQIATGNLKMEVKQFQWTRKRKTWAVSKQNE